MLEVRVAPTKQTIVLIGGAMRSGTTIIYRALCTAQNSNPFLAESWFLNGLMAQFRSNLLQFDIGLKDQFGDRSKYVELMKFNMQYYFNTVSEKYGDPEVLFFKHPGLTTHFVEISELFPKIQYIVVVRDPRDAIASTMQVARKHRESGVVSLHSRLSTIEDFCKHYDSYYLRVLSNREKFGNRLTFVRYEDVMKEPQEIISKVGGRFGASYMEADIARFDETHTSSNYLNKDDRLKSPFGSAFWSDAYTQDISSDKIGSHKNSLAPSEIEEIQIRLNAMGKMFGYWN